MFRHLKIRTKLLVVLAIPLLALVMVITLGLVTLRTVQVNGPRYRELSVAKDLTSDVNPPSQYVVEAYAEVLDTLDTNLAVDVAPKLDMLTQMEARFASRHDYWVSVLPPGPLATALLQDAYQPAREFFQLIDSGFKPAMLAGNRDQARVLATGALSRLYRRHRSAIDNVVTLADAEQNALQQQTSTFIGNRLLLLLIAVGGLSGLSVLVGIMVVRAVSRPLRALTANANEIAERALPGAVAAAQVGQPASPLPSPVSLESRDEIADLARAMTAMQTTALDLAVDQARMRRNVAEMFVNLGRRNQSLLSRQLSFITDLESNERDADTLEDLFRLDHLATRMRRNAESLLVLAGAEPARTWSKPVPVTDVIRSALSEIEAYDRVDLTSVEEATVRGHAAADLAHLLAELLENATSFSPPTTRVTVVGKKRNEGYLVSIVDQGIGMNPSDLIEANRRIAEVARFEEAPSKVLGLFVVGRLGARHSITVQLSESPAEGVTAKVLVPLELLEAPAPPAAPVEQVADAPAPALLADALPATPELDRRLAELVAADPGSSGAAGEAGHDAAGNGAPASLHRRVRGANLFDTGPAPSAEDALPPPDPNQVRTRLSRLADGQHRAQVGAPPPPDAAGLPLTAPAPVALAAAPVALAAAPAGTVAAGTVAAGTVVAGTVAAGTTLDGDLDATPGGLRRRVRGAQLPDTGPSATDDDTPTRDATHVRSALTSFARGVARGREVTAPSDPPGGDPA